MPTTPRTRRPQPRTHHPTAAHLPPHSSAPTRPSQRISAPTSAHFHAHSPLYLPTFYLRDRPTPTHLHPPTHAQTSAILRTFIKRPMHIRALFYRGSKADARRGRGVAPLLTNRCSHTVRAFVRWERSVYPIQTNRCSHAVRAFVRRCREKVYRVSEESL